MMKRFKILVIILCACLLQVQAQTLRVGAERSEKLLPLLDGKRVALVVNQTSVVGQRQTHLGGGRGGWRVRSITIPS